MAHDEQDVPNTIYTVGHSNHSLAFFLELLHRHDIEVLIDTRSSPFSRYAPQFNRDALKSAILDAGLKYGFYGRELGGRPENTDFYDAAGRADYAAVAGSDLFQTGLAQHTANRQAHIRRDGRLETKAGLPPHPHPVLPVRHRPALGAASRPPAGWRPPLRSSRNFGCRPRIIHHQPQRAVRVEQPLLQVRRRRDCAAAKTLISSLPHLHIC